MSYLFAHLQCLCLLIDDDIIFRCHYFFSLGQLNTLQTMIGLQLLNQDMILVSPHTKYHKDKQGTQCSLLF